MENIILLSSNIRLNTDIFETNFINTVILTAILINIGGDLVKASIFERRESISKNIIDANQKVSDATERLKEARVQLEQSQFTIEKIKKDDSLLLTVFLNYLEKCGCDELDRIENTAKLKATSRKLQVLREIKTYISNGALKSAVASSQKDLKLNTHVRLIDRSIEIIGGEEWSEKV